MVFVFGCIISFAAGVLLTGLFCWALAEVEREEALQPLAELKIEKERLSMEETHGYINKLASDYISSSDNVGLAIGVIKDGETRVFGYGSTAKNKQQVPDGDTVFEIASVGKTLTATVLADLHLHGEIDRNMPVDDLLPDKVHAPSFNGKRITLFDLATQTSGLPSLADNFKPGDSLNPYADYTVPDMYQGLAATKLSAPPGTAYAYSNLGFGLLGHVLALKSQTTYEKLVIERVCEPLGMDSTRMTLNDALKSRLATPHDGGKPVLVWTDETLAGAGSFLSTPNDMLAYLKAHMDDEVASLHEAMQTTIEKWRPTDTSATAIGLGWHIDSENAIDIVWHNGGSGGSRSYVAFLPNSKRGVVVLSNSSSEVDALGKKVLYLLHLY